MRTARIRRRAMVVTGIALLALAAMVVPAPFGAAQEEETEPAEVRQEAWYVTPTSDALPPLLTSEFPPGVVCILGPDLCTAEVEELTDPIQDLITGITIPGGPVHPVPPGTLPVGLLGGQDRYTSAIRFVEPNLPDGMMFDLVELLLDEVQPSFAIESPAFRELVRAFVAQAAEDPSPEPFERFVEGVVEGEHDLFVPEPTGIEACAIVEEWEPGAGQESSERPEGDCVFGAAGERSDGVWSFDLTFAAQAWAEGLIPNLGVTLVSVRPENLEYGDPDLSANFQITLAGSEATQGDEPMLRIALVSAAPPIDAPPPGAAPPPIGTLAPPVAAPPAFEPGGPSPASGAPGAPTGPVGARGAPYIPGAFWLFVPLGAAGAALFARGLGVGVEPAVARGGAMTRLTASLGEGTTGGGPPGALTRLMLSMKRG